MISSNRLLKDLAAIISCILVIIACMPVASASPLEKPAKVNAVITTFSATPVYRGIPALSPGDRNTLTFRYSLSAAADIKIEVLKDGAWATILSRHDSSGARSFTWDGKADGNYLAPGSYAVQIYTVTNGTASVPKTLNVVICSPPSVQVSTNVLSFTVGKKSFICITARWDVPTSINITVLNSNGIAVATLYNKSNQTPATKKVYWYGKVSGGAYARPGNYTVCVTAGGSPQTLIPVSVKPSLKGVLVFDSLQGRTVVVRDGTTPSDLSRGAVWHNQTSYPGTLGNCVVFGHRTTVFKGFGALKLGDIIRFNVARSSYVYRIIDMKVVNPGDDLIFHVYDQPVLTVVTCFPFIWHGHAPQRYLVIAKLVT